eukprot:s1211_g15.t1
MSAGKIRLGPDPSVAISDIERKIWETTQRQGCTDLLKLLHSKQPMSWKSAPCGEWLGTDPMCDLFCSLFSMHVNGVMASQKLKKSLLSLQAEKGRLNFSKHHDSDWSDMVDDQLRIAAQQYREIKKDAQKYGRGMAASDEEPVKLTIFSRVLKKEASDPSSPNFQKKPKEKKQVAYKTTFLHRVTSAAWKKAKKEALRKGTTMDEARLAGRKASAEVAEKVNSGQLKEA